MSCRRSLRVLIAFAVVTAASLTGSRLAAEDWTRFRGPRGDGVAQGPLPPTDWSDPANHAWRVELPGRGPSSPLVVGGRVIVTASSGPRNERLHVLAFDAASGRRRWHRQFWATGHTHCHISTANAAPTPASDGRLVFAFYSSNDLVCLDLDGNFHWFRGLAYDWPKTRNDVGMASSPVVVDEVCIVQAENQGDSFVAAIDKRIGTTRWRLARPPVANWSSPLVVTDAAGRSAVVFQGEDGVTAVHPASGAVLWRVALPCATIPSTVFRESTLLVPARGATAMRLASAAEEPQFAWDSNRLGPGTASFVAHRGRLYVPKSAGVLACADLADGEIHWQLRLTGPFWSTPVIVDEYLFLLGGNGLGQVVRLGDTAGELVSSFDFGETLQATPAVSDGAVFVRSDAHLWKIAAPGAGP